MSTTPTSIQAVQIRARRELLVATRRLGLRWEGELEEHIRLVGQAVWRNLTSGRMRRMLGLARDSAPTWRVLSGYIQRVIHFHHLSNAWVSRLERRDEEAWLIQYQKLLQLAEQFLRRNGATVSPAKDYAQQTCEIIYRAFYPRDVPFDAWTHTILYNEIYSQWRSSEVLNKPSSLLVSFEPPAAERPGAARLRASALAAPAESALEKIERVEEQHAILNALAQLQSRAQRDVIAALYLEDLDIAEVEHKYNMKREQIYLLRHRGLKRLRQILQTPQYAQVLAPARPSLSRSYGQIP